MKKILFLIVIVLVLFQNLLAFDATKNEIRIERNNRYGKTETVSVFKKGISEIIFCKSKQKSNNPKKGSTVKNNKISITGINEIKK